MELGLSLGDAPKSFGFLPVPSRDATGRRSTLAFSMALGITDTSERQKPEKNVKNRAQVDEPDDAVSEDPLAGGGCDQRDPPVQLELLPVGPIPRQTPSLQQGFLWTSDNGSSDGGSSGNMGMQRARGFDVNKILPAAAEEVTSPNSVASSFQMDFSIFRGAYKRDSMETAGDAERASSRASDEDDNALARKKLRLSKEQSAYLEESFKEHSTLNPKQKLALAKQLNLRPRQVEVWFQNRRARTKLKQTEVDCEYLKRCCETLTDENRRLHKELQELRALKTSNLFYMQLPATTLTMCPSCERVAATTTTTTTTTSTATASTNTAKIDAAGAGAAATDSSPTSSKAATPFPPASTRSMSFFPFPPHNHNTAAATHPHQSAAS